MKTIDKPQEFTAIDTALHEIDTDLGTEVQYDVVRKIDEAKERFWIYVERSIHLGGQPYEMSADDSAIAGKLVHVVQDATIASGERVPDVPAEKVEGILSLIKADAALVLRRLKQINAASPSASLLPHGPQGRGSRRRVPA